MTTLNVLTSRSPNEAVLSAGNLEASTARYQALVAGKPINLTYKEFELLRVLLSSPDRILPYSDLLGVLWSDAQPGSRRRLGVLVCRLRAKVAASWPYRIETVSGRGYGLINRQGR